MGSERSPVDCHKESLIDKTFYITKIDKSSCSMYISDPADSVIYSIYDKYINKPFHSLRHRKIQVLDITFTTLELNTGKIHVLYKCMYTLTTNVGYQKEWEGTEQMFLGLTRSRALNSVCHTPEQVLALMHSFDACEPKRETDIARNLQQRDTHRVKIREAFSCQVSLSAFLSLFLSVHLFQCPFLLELCVGILTEIKSESHSSCVYKHIIRLGTNEV